MKDRLRLIFFHFTHKWPLPTEGKKYYFLLAFLLVASFLVSLVSFFPVNALKGSVERDLSRNLNSDVAIGSLALEFPLRIRATNVRATLPTPAPYVLRFDTLFVSPVWNSFVRGGSAYAFSGSLNQGSLEGEADEDGNLLLNLRDVRFNLPLDAKGVLLLGGIAREAHLSGQYPPGGNDEVSLSLSVDSLELIGAKMLGLKEDILPLGQLRLRSRGQGRTLRIEQLTLSGGAVHGDASGALMLRSPLDLSNLRLTAVLRTDPGTPEIGTLLSLLKQPSPDGSYQIRLLGTLQRPLLR